MIQRFVVLAVLIFAGGVQAQERPWLNAGLPNETRIQAVLDAMTVEV